MNRKAQQDTAAQAAVENARDWGRDYFKRYPDLMLVEVSREGAQRFGDSPRTIAFLRGYVEARAQHDAWQEGE